jgi:hypothetical protein
MAYRATSDDLKKYNFTDMLRTMQKGIGSRDVASSSIKIRLGFLRKVYGIVSVQLLVTTLIAGAFLTFESISCHLANSWLFYGQYGLFITTCVLIYLMAKYKSIYPVNYICLAAFTVCEAPLVGIFATLYKAESIVLGFGVTCALTTALAIYSMQSRRDFSSWGASLFAGLLNLTALLLINLFLRDCSLELFLTVIGTLLFSLYIIYDINEMMKSLSAEEYIMASVSLYLDIINLFINSVKLFGNRRND